MDAARHWAAGGGRTREREEDRERFYGELEGFGAPEEVLNAEREADAEAAEPFDVYPENWSTVQVFRALQTQWEMKVGERAVYVGLKYESFPVGMVIAAVPGSERRLVYMGLQLMEFAALEVLNANKGDE